MLYACKQEVFAPVSTFALTLIFSSGSVTHSLHPIVMSGDLFIIFRDFIMDRVEFGKSVVWDIRKITNRFSWLECGAGG